MIFLLGIALQTATALTAQEILTQTRCRSLARYINDGTTVGFDQVDSGYPGDFVITGATGYFVYCTTPANLTVNGTLIQNRTDTLYNGWNLYGEVNGTTTTATAILTAIGSYAKSIARYIAGQGYEQVDAGYAGDFNVNDTTGLFIYVNQTTTWTRRR